MGTKQKLRWAAGLALVLAGGAGATLALQQLRKPERAIATTLVRRGSLETKVHTTGELRPARTAMLVAPAVGGTLKIVKLIKTGTGVKAGDLVIEFDPSEQQHNLEQSRSELEQAEEEITKAKADAAVQAAQDQVALLKARFDMRRAELEVSKNELVSQIDAKKNLLALEEAKRALAQLEEDVKSRAASSQATIAVNEEKRGKALVAMKQAQKNIDDMRVRAPINGLVAVKENREASGGFFFSGMALPEYREGDQLWPGSFMAEILGVEQMEIQAKVTEGDRANLTSGQRAEVQVYSVPGQKFTAKVKTVAGLASRAWWSESTGKKFDASFTLDRADPRLRPGLTAEITILGDPMKDVLLLPRQALFEKDGKPVAYIKTGSTFEAKEVKIARRTESRVAIEGLKEGTEVALVNPEQEAKGAIVPAGPSLPGAPGGGR